ncbi:MAG: TonB family protein [Gemmatimonadaceae bacterium]|nr:TonB family protein [Geodermatophilaceae bacterium]MBA3672718.1 TonB family protein [Gemmatimonadaceae bacterium]
MFNNLIETRPAKQRSTGGIVVSGIVHALLIWGAVVGTLSAKEAYDKPKAEKVEFVEIKKKEPPPKEEPVPPPPDVVHAPPPPKGFQVLTAPIKVPDVLPDIDLSRKVTDEADFSGKGVAGGVAKGVVGGTAPVSDQPYFEFQVEKQVQQIPGTGNLRYPDMLRSANVEGEVLAQFVVDADGRYEAGTFKVLKSSHELFTQAVKNALPNMRFYAAEVGGKKVKQLVQQPFTFSLTKSE